jgi:6-phosphofructokinase 2
MKSQTIVTLTMNPAIDKSSSVDRVIAEWKLRCKPPFYEAGGGGINVSRAIKRLGGASYAIYTMGDHLGRMLRDLLESEGIDHHPVEIRGLTRENLIIYEESSGQQYRFGMPGPELEEDEWKRCLSEIASLEPAPEFIVASGSLPPGVPEDFYARVAKLGKERGCKVAVDTSGSPLMDAAEVGVFLLKPNLREMGFLHDEEGMADVEAAARKLIHAGKGEVVVISLGRQGAVFVTPDQAHKVWAPAVPIQSKVGAGDSMVAGIVLSLAKGSSMLEAVTFGVACGSAAVMTPGTELCRREDAERLYEKIVETQMDH